MTTPLRPSPGSSVLLLLVCCLCCLASPLGAQPTIPAFAGAGGGGAVSVGGRGGRVIEVTTLVDGGSGSLREAISASGPRTVVFRVGGTIELVGALTILEPFITIAGQTAPGGGILISGAQMNDTLIKVRTHDVIIRFLRLRRGAGPAPGAADGLGVYDGGHNVIVDHCSFSWATDECLDIWSAANPAHHITYSWNFVAETLGAHSTGLLTGSDVNSEDMVNIAVHHNLFMSNSHRNPLIKVGSARVINNLAYNFKNWSLGFGGGTRIDIYGNQAKAGPVSTTSISHMLYRQQSEPPNIAIGPEGDPSIFIDDNLDWNITDSLTDNWSMMELTIDWQRQGYGPDREVCERLVPQADLPFPVITHPVTYVEALLDTDVGASRRLDENGAWVPARDAVDLRLLEEYHLGLGQIPDHEDEVGGFPVIPTGTPYADADHDGMADTWEALHGLDNQLADDALDLDGDGFTNLEEFLGGTDPEVSDRGPTVFSAIPLLGDRARYRERRSDGWTVVEDGGDLRYAIPSSDYDSPEAGILGQWAVLPDHLFGNVSLTTLARSGDDFDLNSGADLCLILGWQDDANHYYAMFNRADHASAIFLVSGGIRTELANVGANTFVDNDYHRFEFRRDGEALTMSMDDVVVAAAVDTTLGPGLIGVGSFNDSVYFDDIQAVELVAVDAGSDTSSGPDIAPRDVGTTDAAPAMDRFHADLTPLQDTRVQDLRAHDPLVADRPSPDRTPADHPRDMLTPDRQQMLDTRASVDGAPVDSSRGGSDSSGGDRGPSVVIEGCRCAARDAGHDRSALLASWLAGGLLCWRRHRKSSRQSSIIPSS